MSQEEGRPRRRWPRVFAALLGLVVVGAVVGAVLNTRYLEGSVPGESPILGLAATEDGWVAATTTGLFVTFDGVDWRQPVGLERGRSLVTSHPDGAIALVDNVVLKTEDLREFTSAVGSIQPGIALATDNDGNIYVAEDAKTFSLFLVDGGLRRATATGGPREIVALDATAGEPVTLYAGGLTSGFWRSTTGGASWRQILKTPVRAIVVDPEDPKRIFIGTAGGVLVSKDGGSRWAFTEMRSSIEAITAARGKVHVLTQERLLFSSDDGLKDYKRAGS